MLLRSSHHRNVFFFCHRPCHPTIARGRKQRQKSNPDFFFSSVRADIKCDFLTPPLPPPGGIYPPYFSESTFWSSSSSCVSISVCLSGLILSSMLTGKRLYCPLPTFLGLIFVFLCEELQGGCRKQTSTYKPRRGFPGLHPVDTTQQCAKHYRERELPHTSVAPERGLKCE